MPDRDERPMPMRRDSRSATGEDLYVLACNARRDAGDLAFANIVRLERDIDALRADLEWKQTHAATRSKSWVTSRMMYVASMITVLVLGATWLKVSDFGKAFRIGFARGSSGQSYNSTVKSTLKPEGITGDMTRAQIDSISAVIEGERARKYVAEQAGQDARRKP